LKDEIKKEIKTIVHETKSEKISVDDELLDLEKELNEQHRVEKESQNKKRKIQDEESEIQNKKQKISVEEK
jgi:hypothetical protein